MDTLGVETPDDYTITFYLAEPCVYFLDLLRLPVYTPSCSEHADSVDSGWDRDPEDKPGQRPVPSGRICPGTVFRSREERILLECG